MARMRRSKAQIGMMAAAVVSFFSFSCAHAQTDPALAAPGSEPTQRLCKDEDLTPHVFKMLDFKETPPRAEALWVSEFPYHYLAFGPNKSYAAMAFNTEFKDPKRIVKFLNGTFNRNNFYALDKNGTLTIVQNEKIKYVYRCVAVLKKYDVYLPGDLILTGYTKRRKSELYKFYRRWY